MPGKIPYFWTEWERKEYLIKVEEENSIRFPLMEQEKREKELQKEEFDKLELKLNSLRQVLEMHIADAKSNKDKESIPNESDETTETFEEKGSDESTETIEEKESTSTESTESTDSDDDVLITVKKRVLDKLNKDEYEILGKQKKQNDYTPFLLMSQTQGPPGNIPGGLLRTKMINEYHPLFDKVTNAIKTKRFPDRQTEIELWKLLRGEGCCLDCDHYDDDFQKQCDCDFFVFSSENIKQKICQFLDVIPEDFKATEFKYFTYGEEKIGLDAEYHDNDEVKNILFKKGIIFLEEYYEEDDENY